MTTDDRINLAILIATLAFLAWAVPARMAEHDDAEFGRAVRLR